MPSIFPGSPRNFRISLRPARLVRILLFSGACLAAGVAPAQTTGTTGSDAAFDNQQPTVTLTQALVTSGVFPSHCCGGGTAMGDMLGFIYPFAGGFAPAGSLDARGQTLAISMNAALYSLMGTTYGGNGSTTFSVPDLGDRAEMGAGTGAGLTPRTLGGTVGSATVTLLTAQIPSHVHSLPGGGFTGATGGSQPFDNVQPSLPLQRVIATSGTFPSSGGGGGTAAFLGQVATFAGNFVPDGWTAADGRSLSIIANSALFALIGTQFGGDGVSTFALPDLRGRVVIGADATNPVGSTFGAESSTVTAATMAAHTHTTAGGPTGIAGSGLPLDNRQPSLALNYIIATQGLFPSATSGGFDTDFPLIGQIAEFAGNFAPSGWALCDGTLLPVATNGALFSVLGTRYGGDGVNTFALPDLRGRTLAGISATRVAGTVVGAASTTLAVANLPAHSHTAILAAPTITSATYDAATGALTVTGTGLLANASGLDIAASKFTLTGEGGFTYTLTDTSDVEISSSTSFTLTLSATDRAFLKPIFNKNGTSSTGGTTYNLSAAEDWDTGADPAVNIADTTGNGITVSNVAIPAITSATYNAATGALAVTGSGFLSLSGAANDVVANKLTLTGEGGATYTLTDTANVEITSGTAFTITLSATDRAGVNPILNKNGTSSAGGTTYNLAAAEDWAAGANPALVVADTTGNGITVSNVAVPTITNATYDASTGILSVTGTGFVVAGGAANDIVANKLTITGEGGATYTLTDTANVEITSGTAFTITLSATDRASVNLILNKNGTSSTAGTTYNVAAAEDWAAGADAAVTVADLTGNGITVSGIAPPVVNFIVTPSAGPNGTIAPATPQTVVAGAAAVFTVTPSAGYSASVGGTCGGTLAGSTYTTHAINASCSVVASFTAIPVTTFSGPSPTGSGTITASFTGGGAGCGFASSAFIPLVGAARSPPAGSAPANVSFPHGLFDFTLSGCTAGSTVSFTIVYPQPLPAGTAYWKYGPTPADASPHWYQLPASVSGDTVTFSIADGNTGDDDLAANGTIVDQGGPGVPGGAGAPVPVPTLSEWMLMALAMLLLLAGMGTMRRRS